METSSRQNRCNYNGIVTIKQTIRVQGPGSWSSLPGEFLLAVGTILVPMRTVKT